MINKQSFIRRFVSWTVDYGFIWGSLSMASKVSVWIRPEGKFAGIDPIWFGAAALILVFPFRLLCKKIFSQSPGIALAASESSSAQKIFQLLALVGFFCFAGIPEHKQSSSNNLSTVAVVAEGWKVATGSDHPFKIAFPESPADGKGTLQLPGRNNSLDFKELRSTTVEGIVYSLSYLDLPKRWMIFRAHTILGTALKLISEQNFQAEIVANIKTEHGAHPAIDFIIKEGNSRQQGRMILVGNTLYRLMVITPENVEIGEQHVQSFVSSFEAKTLS